MFAKLFFFAIAALSVLVFSGLLKKKFQRFFLSLSLVAALGFNLSEHHQKSYADHGCSKDLSEKL